MPETKAVLYRPAFVYGPDLEGSQSINSDTGSLRRLPLLSANATLSLDTLVNQGFATIRILRSDVSGFALTIRDTESMSVLAISDAPEWLEFIYLPVEGAWTLIARGSLEGGTGDIVVNATLPNTRVTTTAALPAHTRSGNTLTASANGVLGPIDGVALVTGDSVLVRFEDEENGGYILTQGTAGTPWVLSRATWLDESSEAVQGTLVHVREGTANSSRFFVLTTVAPIVLNTTPLTFQALIGYSPGSTTFEDVVLSGDLAAVNSTLSGDLAAVNSTLSGNLTAVDGTLSGNLGVGDAVPADTRLYVDHANDDSGGAAVRATMTRAVDLSALDPPLACYVAEPIGRATDTGLISGFVAETPNVSGPIYAAFECRGVRGATAYNFALVSIDHELLMQAAVLTAGDGFGARLSSASAILNGVGGRVSIEAGDAESTDAVARRGGNVELLPGLGAGGGLRGSVDIGSPGIDDTAIRIFGANNDIEPLSFNFGLARFPNASAPHNEVMNFGWNVDINGNRLIAGEHVLRDSWESEFDTGSARLCERHWQYTSANGLTTRRMLSTSVNLADHTCDVVVNGDFQVFDSTGAQQRIIIQDAPGAGTNFILNSCELLFNRNNVALIRGINSELSDYVNCLLVDTGEAVQVGGTNATAIKLLVGSTIVEHVGSGGVQIAVGAVAPASNLIFEAASTTKGSRPAPPMTTAQRDAIAAPTDGMQIYNTTTGRIDYYSSAAGAWIGQQANIVALTDNSGGTADNTIAAISAPVGDAGGTATVSAAENVATVASVTTMRNELRNAIADLAAKVNAIITTLDNLRDTA